MEVKILASILATRLAAVITSLIHEDQSGFMPGRATRFNLRRLANWISEVQDRPEAHLLLSLDAEKAFDAVHWPFMWQTLQRLGFGLNLISWVKLLYRAPMARVRVNGAMSAEFAIERGTRQGCPLCFLHGL